jgi:hypothetical protein
MTISQMKKNGLRSACISALVSGILTMAAAYGAEPPEKDVAFKADTRGFGNVEVTLRPLGEKKDASWTTFATQDAEHAKVTGSKRLADLLGFGDLKAVADSGLPGTVVELKGAGWWLLGLDGSKLQELYAPTREVLAKLAQDAKASAWQAVPARAYPRWLDCFDNAGTGIWFGGGGMPVDITTEFPWMKERGFTFNFHPPSESRYVAPGVLDTTQTDWFSAMCARYDIPFRAHCWESKPSWLWNRESLPYVRGVPGYLKGNFGFAAQSLYGIPYGSEPVSASDPYTHDFRRRFMDNLNTDPNFLASKAVAEIPDAGVGVLAAVAGMPETKAYWQSYLVRELGLDLPKVGLLHHGRRDFYKSWDQVAVPTPRDFLGLDANSVELSGAGWEGMTDREAKGAAAKWYAPETMPKEGWVAVNSNDPMLLLTPYAQHGYVKRADFWLKRTVSFTEAQLPHLKYLHMTRPPLRGKSCDAWLNGQPLKQITPDLQNVTPVCFELGNALRTGENQFILRLEGYPPMSFIALGPLPPRPYLYMSEPENRRWYDATNFSAWLRMRGVEQTLQAMRAGDPNRPLKLMALGNQQDFGIELCERYGVYQHDTGGSGAFWWPWSGARLARSHGLPWSCEQAGPPDNAAGFQSDMTYYLRYGNDAVDLVFATSAYKDKPDIAAWIDKNIELMKCIGKMHLPMPTLGILKSARMGRLGLNAEGFCALGRGPLQSVGRNFAQIETGDLLNGVIDQFPVVMDSVTEQMTPEEVDGIRRYVERGGVFIATYNTARHLPERADAWPLAASLGVKVNPKWVSEKDFSTWADVKIKFGEQQDLMPSLRGKEIAGAGVFTDHLNREYSAGVSYAPDGGKAGADFRPVATWSEDGSVAVAEVKLGRGKVILLGTVFFARMRDVAGIWYNADDRRKLLDEFLAGAGVSRDSWADAPEMCAELWRSKSGVYDLYSVARMTNKTGPGGSVTDSFKVTETSGIQVSLRRTVPVSELIEVSALGHPKVKVEYKDGKVVLPATDYGLMQSRVYIAPRAEIARSGLDWFQVQSKLWRALPPLPSAAKPAVIPVPEDVIPAAEGWRMNVGETNAAWIQQEFADAAWKTVKLGTFVTLGLPEDAKAQFRKTITIPAAWQGRQINLAFNPDGWFWGIGPEAQLWINGKLAGVKQPLRLAADGKFSLDVTEQAKEGKLTLALEVDGGKLDKTKPQARPSGVTGIFLLEAVPPTVAKTPLAGPWFAAKDVGVLTPVAAGEKATYTYLETKFTLPKEWPAKRVFLETPGLLNWVILNNQVINASMHSLDVSGLVRKDGENVLRWKPNFAGIPDITSEQNGAVPELNLVWKN